MATKQELKKTNPLHQEFQDLLDQEFKSTKVKEGEIIKATITEILSKYVVADANLKQEAHIPIEEFKHDDEIKNLKVGQKIDVFLERLESGKNGEIIISRDKARRLRAWERMVKIFEKQEETDAIITQRIRGGYIANCSGLDCFLPSSQLSSTPLKRVDHLMGVPIRVIPVRLDRIRGNCAVSRRKCEEKSKSAAIAESLKTIKEGDVVEATCTAIVEWGCFLQYKTLIMLCHISDMDHFRVKKPSDVVKVGEKLTVKITKIDPITQRISCSSKALFSDPYDNLKYKVGEIYEGTAVKIMQYGIFCQLQPGVEGLIHSSMLSFTNRNIEPSKVMSVGKKVKVKVLSIDKEARRISLSYKDNGETENPWEKVKKMINKEVKIKVNTITDKAIFATLSDTGLVGMLPYREISYDENVEDLKKFKKNDIINVKIISVKDEKIRFSKRILEKDPMDWFKENKKKVGSVISTKVVEVLKNGVKVAIDPEKKIIVTIKKNLLAVEPADCRPEIYSPGNTMADAKIIELSVEDRKIVLSPKEAQKDEEQSLVAKFGRNAAKSGASLKGIFSAALGGKLGGKKKKEKK